jgi:hypothetical protein
MVNIPLAQAIKFIFNAQHDCRAAKCRPSAFRHQMQERQETTCTISLISHQDDGHFVLNLHALHNAALIRQVLPRHLTSPKPLYNDRQARHFEIATKLRVTQALKRETTKAKGKATREANNAKKRQASGLVGNSVVPAADEDEDSEIDGEGNAMVGIEDAHIEGVEHLRGTKRARGH